MRLSESSKTGKTVSRLLAVFLLAGTAAGCSSDASRFGGLFSSKTDGITTNSIRRVPRNADGTVPTPRADVDQAGQIETVQPMTAEVTHEPIQTSTNGISGVRAAVTPMKVEKASLDSPSDTVMTPAKTSGILADSEPARPATFAGKGVKVKVEPGQTLLGIARTHGVPARTIMEANGISDANSIRIGQTLVIPSDGKVKAKAPVDFAADDSRKKKPDPIQPKEEVAVLPANARDKSKAVSDQKLASADGESDAAAPGKGEDGIYVVQAGDSLAKIARNNKTTVDALKAANGLETAQLRIGQKLRLSGDAPAIATARDATTTGAIPADSSVKDVAAAKPKTYTAPADTKTLDEVEKADAQDSAPESTGISKYRWPVRGQVVAGYGANVDGKRNTGIDISVPEGTPIKAAENGVVIYSGAGLKELGNTVLIRHDDGTVTVYGNASELKVTRGQKVQRGQTIAASGMTGGAKQPKLHFEVRKASSPVNPMTFLE